MSQFYTALVFPLILLVGQAIVALGQRKISQRMDEGQAKTDAKRKAEAEWRDSIDKRLNDMESKLDELEKKQNRSISQQAVQIRADIVHKCHRYLDDLGRASSEEKETLDDAYKKYCEFCEDLDMENDFIDLLVKRVMKLPEREV